MSSLSSSSAPPSRKLLQSSRPNTPHFPIADPPQPLTVDSDVVVILAALLCALICVVGLALVARCAWLRRTPPSPSNPNSTPHPPPPNKGLKKKAIKSLPKFAFHSSPSSPSDSCSKAVECPICLQEFAEGDEIRILPQCEHIFHVSCVDTWLVSHSSCPFCRQVLVVSSSAPAPLRCQKCGADSSAAATAAVEGDGNRFLP